MNAFALEPDGFARDSRSRWPSSLDVAIGPGIAAIVAIAIQSLWIPIDADVSWLITVCERMLAGDRLYIDIFEVNPPASVWLYMPLVWLAQLIGAKPEAVVAFGFVAAALLSISATLRLASRLDDPPSPLGLAAVLGFVTLVLPMGLFAQREHAALLMALPSLTALALIAEHKPVSRASLYAYGFVAGLIIVIKPYFILAVAAPALWAAWKRRSLAPLLPAIAASLLAIALYAIALATFAGAYLDYLPTLTRTYGAMHNVWWKVVIGPTLYPAICLGLALLARSGRIPAISLAWAFGALGFLLAAFAQAKGYPNHWLPQAALAFAATFSILFASGAVAAPRKLIGGALAIVGLFMVHQWAIRPDPDLTAAIKQVAPPAPKVIALSTQLTTGHPVTRNVGGTWVGSRAGLFTTSGAYFVGLDDPLVKQSYLEDVGSFAKDIARHSPDVVLVHRPAKGWLMDEPGVAQAMAAYRPAAEAGDTEIWVRRAAAN